MKSAEECGFKVPKSEIVRVGTLPSILKYPILTKAIDSTNPLWKTYVHICKDEQELKLAYSQMEGNQNILLQEYIEKKNEFILQGIVISSNVDNNGFNVIEDKEGFIATYGGTELCIPIQGAYLRLQNGAYGSYLYFEQYSKGKKMLQKLCRLFNEIGYSGIFEIEFLLNNNDELIFLEINFRHTLWNHTFTNMGCNLCKLWADSAIAGHLVLDDIKFKSQNRHILISEFVDMKTYLLTGKVSIIKWLKQCITADSYVIYDCKDKKPFYRYLLKHIKK